MGYIYLLCVAIMFSFGGTCNKNISPYFSTEYVTLFRFLFGVFFLFLLKLVTRHHFRPDFKAMCKVCAFPILLGAVAKWGAYLTENYAIAHGPSYGNIITQPAQTVFLTLASAFLFKEKLTGKKVICIILCAGGVLCISWNGKPLDEFLQNNIFLTLLFVVSGAMAGMHVLAQKVIADKMHIIDSNLAIFSVSLMLSLIQVTPNVVSGGLQGIHPGLTCLIAAMAFGFITGIGFYLNAKAIPLVPLYMVPVIQSTMVIFAVLWGILFFHETISVYIVVGIAVFLVGLIWLNILNKTSEKKQ